MALARRLEMALLVGLALVIVAVLSAAGIIQAACFPAALWIGRRPAR